jgi:type VI secretion system protein ImpF
MWKSKTENLVTQSLLDRLIDVDDWPTTRSSSMRMYRDSLKRDVEWLLNTRKPPIPNLQSYPRAYASVINFGLPDINSFSGSAERDNNSLMLAIMQTLRDYEPRILSPRVFLVRNDTANRHIRFHIEGQIMFDSIPEDISFDTVLELSSGEYEVK